MQGKSLGRNGRDKNERLFGVDKTEWFRSNYIWERNLEIINTYKVWKVKEQWKDNYLTNKEEDAKQLFEYKKQL
jgi:hypothetical protein